jgi:hypothetical protein
MGLLEKALEFKKEMISRGRETVMDRIKGPAETDFLSGNPDGIRAADPSPESSGDILVLGNGDLRIIEDESPGPEIEAESSADGIPRERSPHEASPSADREYLKDFPEAGIHDEMKDVKMNFPLRMRLQS